MSVQEQLKKREAGAVERQALTSRPHLLALSLLFLAVAAAYAPVLLHPHWGLFSDAGQILEECRKFFDANCTRLDILCDQYRPGFNVVDKVIWLFSPERPFGFYAVRWLLFEATVLLCYGNCFLLSRSPLFFFFLLSLLADCISNVRSDIHSGQSGDLYRLSLQRLPLCLLAGPAAALSRGGRRKRAEAVARSCYILCGIRNLYQANRHARFWPDRCFCRCRFYRQRLAWRS